MALKRVRNQGVWIEINRQLSHPSSPMEIARFVEGTPLWEPIVDYIVVSSTPGNAGLYQVLLDAFSAAHGRPLSIPLIPGLKTNSIFRERGLCPQTTFGDPPGSYLVCNLNDLAAWQAVADELNVFIDTTGLQTILMETEGTVVGHSLGETTADTDIVRAGIDLFPKDVEYWWYPAIVSGASERRDRQQIICEIVAEVLPNVRFVDLGHQSHSRVFLDSSEAGKLANEALVDRRVNGLMYVYPSGFWQHDRVRQVLKYLYSDGDVMLYPGGVDFVSQGQIFNDLLLHR